MFLGEIFQIQTQTINGWPNPTRVKKNFTRTHHYFGQTRDWYQVVIEIWLI